MEQKLITEKEKEQELKKHKSELMKKEQKIKQVLVSNIKFKKKIYIIQ